MDLSLASACCRLLSVSRSRIESAVWDFACNLALTGLKPLMLRQNVVASSLGAGLAAIHAAPAPADWRVFGFPLEGCCGACPQKNNAEVGCDTPLKNPHLHL
eukprot:1257003-Amphidinium_carterae.1